MRHSLIGPDFYQMQQMELFDEEERLRIADTDRQIDQLVYELYGLTDEEIRIVEEATAVRT